jgi:hypothetical protein
VVGREEKERKDAVVECEGKRRKSNVVLEVCGLLYKKEGGRKEVERQRRRGVFMAARRREKLVRADFTSEVT